MLYPFFSFLFTGFFFLSKSETENERIQNEVILEGFNSPRKKRGKNFQIFVLGFEWVAIKHRRKIKDLPFMYRLTSRFG
jgi:hypothetical protein